MRRAVLSLALFSASVAAQAEDGVDADAPKAEDWSEAEIGSDGAADMTYRDVQNVIERKMNEAGGAGGDLSKHPSLQGDWDKTHAYDFLMHEVDRCDWQRIDTKEILTKLVERIDKANGGSGGQTAGGQSAGAAGKGALQV